MKVDITGNPGTGNTFQEIHIGTVQNYNPNATTVINNNYGDKLKSSSAPDKALQDAEKESLRADIMAYVGRLDDYVAKDWKNRYKALWTSILALPEVDAVVYTPGRQQGTTFNRNLVASIIYIMCNKNVIAEKNAKTLTKILENDGDHAVRHQLRKEPNKEIADKIKELIG